MERDGPRYAGAAPQRDPGIRARGDTLRIVTFNIAFARNVDAAIAVLSADTNLRAADVVLLQEMTADATQRIAGALKMGYAYYPAINHTRSRQDFGNAVLSRWPIVTDEKLILPHRSRYARTQRSATATTRFGNWDHVVVRGLELPRELSAGIAADNGASDHRAVWVSLLLP